ncbi:hypothetical protein AAFF_G00076710 [Aldrovandia affinis]|uniref:Uncharacterized protein n=1 Tax=Aldrovandia affinis TaxID=143900 RepID=A0AAD7WCS8_9TELE|nr:hypothetical protein AAFF_G00076710 [Aldrovandia affinis]
MCAQKTLVKLSLLLKDEDQVFSYGHLSLPQCGFTARHSGPRDDAAVPDDDNDVDDDNGDDVLLNPP